MKIFLRILLGAAVGTLVLAPLQAQSAPGNGVCAAFSAQGGFAKAKLSRGTLAVEVSPASGSPLNLVMPLILSGNACHAFYSKNGDLLAVSIEDTLRLHAQVQVAVADLRAGKWMQATPYAAAIAEDARGPFRGFLGEHTSLLVMANGTYFPDEERSLIYPVLIQVPEGSVNTGLIGYRGPAFTHETGTLDPGNARIWFPGRQDVCGFQSVVLDMKDVGTSGPSIKGDPLRAAGCLQTDLVLAPSANNLIVGFPKANEYLVATLDVATGQAQTVALQATGREGFLKPRSTAVAPASNAAAIEFSRFDDTHSGLKRSATEIMVFNAEPLRLVNTVRIPEGSDLLALGQSGGALSLAVADKKGKVTLLKAEK